eukprot:3669226-Rhodomonas_salina.4
MPSLVTIDACFAESNVTIDACCPPPSLQTHEPCCPSLAGNECTPSCVTSDTGAPSTFSSDNTVVTPSASPSERRGRGPLVQSAISGDPTRGPLLFSESSDKKFSSTAPPSPLVRSDRNMSSTNSRPPSSSSASSSSAPSPRLAKISVLSDRAPCSRGGESARRCCCGGSGGNALRSELPGTRGLLLFPVITCTMFPLPLAPARLRGDGGPLPRGGGDCECRETSADTGDASADTAGGLIKIVGRFGRA